MGQTTRNSGFSTGRGVTILLGLVVVLAGEQRWLAGTVSGAEPVSNLKTDEQVVFFPVPADRSENGRDWRTTIHAWVFEPRLASSRAAILRLAIAAAVEGVEPSENKLLVQRLAPFAADDERGKTLVIRIGDRPFTLAATEPNGHSETILEIPAALARTWAKSGRLTFTAVLPDGDPRTFSGDVHLIDAQGWSVVSDIDDTIRHSEVRDKSKLLRNTFLRPFEAVEGMADVYRRWADAGARFHFVSASPWQLYEPLADFAREENFPPATFHQRRAQLSDGTFLALLQQPRDAKVATISTLLSRWPQRSFVLVGDSGEYDPEVYGELARKFPGRIARIFIRDVTNESRDSQRYRQAMRDVPDALWIVFTKPEQMVLPESLTQVHPEAIKLPLQGAAKE